MEKFKLPMGVLPIGKENRMAKNLFPASANFTEARLMAEATMCVTLTAPPKSPYVKNPNKKYHCIKGLKVLPTLDLTTLSRALFSILFACGWLSGPL